MFSPLLRPQSKNMQVRQIGKSELSKRRVCECEWVWVCVCVYRSVWPTQNDQGCHLA